MKRMIVIAALAASTVAQAQAQAQAQTVVVPPPPQPGLRAALSYPFLEELTSAEHADRIAWVRIVDGVRNVWTAAGPDFRAVPLTRATEDDGQELTGLVLSPDGRRAVWTRGGDHDGNWPAEGGLQPDPSGDTEQPKLTIWTAATSGGAPVKVDEGDAPAISATGRIAYLKDGKVWATSSVAGGKPELLFFDRGKDEALAWSPDSGRLAFVSRRGDHSLVGLFTARDKPIAWIAPSTGFDEAPVWSPDGRRLAFTRRPGAGGAPEPHLIDVPHPWSIVVADAASGVGVPVWRSPGTLNGSYPTLADGADLIWAAGDRLAFRAELDGWAHLYSIRASGGEPLLLTPGAFIAEHVALSRDKTSLLYDANSGPATEDDDRRHLFAVPVDRAAPQPLSHGTGIEWTPVSADAVRVAYIAAGPTRPAEVRIAGAGGEAVIGTPASSYRATMVTPRRVTFQASDGMTIHGQVFEPPRGAAQGGAAQGGAGRRPALIFVHGGPTRQMLLGFHYMDYYAHAYAMNQYLASRGFVVLSVNYRLGIGYGRAFQHPAQASFAGASEYRDVLAGAKFLAALPEVDPNRMGIWGGSYGGYLTALALARDSATFKAGVDFHGVHDWSRTLSEQDMPVKRYEQGDWDATLRTAYQSSPVADIATWRSPVLLVQGDDDRNVRFNQTVDLARRLDAQGVDYRELVVPDEIHFFLRAQDWVRADAATVQFLEAQLKP